MRAESQEQRYLDDIFGAEMNFRLTQDLGYVTRITVQGFGKLNLCTSADFRLQK
jgi:hypothetical protein